MATYPKQLALYDEHYIGASSPIKSNAHGNRVVYSNGFTPPVDVTVNDLLAVIDDTLYGIDLTGITHNKRTRPRNRKFDTTFGETVVYPGGVAMTGDTRANEMIEVMRVLYDIDRSRGTQASPKTGYATSVLN